MSSTILSIPVRNTIRAIQRLRSFIGLPLTECVRCSDVGPRGNSAETSGQSPAAAGRGPDQLVEQAERATAGPRDLGQRPRRARGAVPKQAPPRPDQLRAQGDAEPVELAGLEQGADDARAAQDDDVAALLLPPPPADLGRIDG